MIHCYYLLLLLFFIIYLYNAHMYTIFLGFSFFFLRCRLPLCILTTQLSICVFLLSICTNPVIVYKYCAILILFVIFSFFVFFQLLFIFSSSLLLLLLSNHLCLCSFYAHYSFFLHACF